MNGPLLHDTFPGTRERLAHVRLGRGPTPVRALTALSDGPAPVWIKDEGPYGDGPWGGNKVRKLEWTLAEARRRGARTVLTFGALGTNHGLATALYAREQGLQAALGLVDQPVDEHVREQLRRLRDSGAVLHMTRSKARTVAALPWLAARHARGLRPPYLLPAGGSSPLGCLGYVEAALELARQVESDELPEPSHVVLAVGSGGTAAGLALGMRLAGLRTRVVGVVVNDKLRLDAPRLARLAQATARVLRRRGANLPPGRPLQAGAFDVTTEWLGPGYGHPTPESRAALRTAGEREGLVLDPVYTAKAFASLLAANAAGRFGAGPVLYLHTYGPRR